MNDFNRLFVAIIRNVGRHRRLLLGLIDLVVAVVVVVVVAGTDDDGGGLGVCA